MHISGLENLKRTPVILTIRRSCPPSRLPIKADKAPGLIILHRSNWVRFANPKGAENKKLMRRPYSALAKRS